MTDVQIILGLLRRVRAQERIIFSAQCCAYDSSVHDEMKDTEKFVKEAQEMSDALEDD